jgi:hypothetical protein
MIFEGCDTQTKLWMTLTFLRPFSVPRCEHGVESHVKQFRHPSMAAHAYYYCRYTVVSI